MVADVALFVTAAGLIAALFALRQSYRERLRQFEAMYVQRYWSIIDRLSLDALGGSAAASPGPADERAIRAYLLLCEDELEMRARGYIGDGTYRIWADGMRGQLAQPMFESVWEKVCSEPTFPYERLAALSSQVGASYDPLAASRPRRWIRGLAGISGV
jgi:hypothetical protein